MLGLQEEEYKWLQNLNSLIDLNSEVRCSGGLPRCTNCQANDLTCNYDQARRDRLREAMRLNQIFEDLLREASMKANAIDRQKILDALDNADPSLIARGTPPSMASLGKRSRQEADHNSREMHGEEDVTGSVGSNGEVESLGEDLSRNQEARDTGYIGQNSEVQWLRSLQRQAESANPRPGAAPHQYGPPGTGSTAADKRSHALQERRLHSKHASMQNITDSTFYLDTEDLELAVAVDPHELPDFSVAEQLFNRYLDTIHSSFPLMPANYLDQIRRFLGSMKAHRPFSVPDKWRATMNIIFAIGAKHLHLTGEYPAGEEPDHGIYMTRAIHLLGLQNTVLMITSPDLNLVEATGLLALYFLVIGHVSKSWITIGMSIRFAMALGLHLRNEDRSTSPARKEILQTKWWSLHAIESVIASITGRPSIAPLEDCTVGFPEAPWDHPDIRDEDLGVHLISTSSQPASQTASRTSTSSPGTPYSKSYFTAHIHITMIVRKVHLHLYAPRTAAFSWKLIEINISELLGDLEEWASKYLSEDVIFEVSHQENFKREQLLLHMHWLSTRMTITRPCLCRLDRRIVDMSKHSQDFNSRMAAICVESAGHMVDSLPDHATLAFVGFSGPWWSMVHIIMQTLAILLLELVHRLKEQVNDYSEIVANVKKLLRWLRTMSVKDAVAERACLVVSRILSSSEPGIQPQINAIFANDLRHSGEEQEKEIRQLDVLAQPGLSGSQSARASDRAMHTQDQQFIPSYADSNSNLLDPNLDAFQQMQPVDYQDVPLSFGNPFTTNFDELPPSFDFQNMWGNTWPVDQTNLDFFSTANPEELIQQVPLHPELASEHLSHGQTSQTEPAFPGTAMDYSHPLPEPPHRQ